MTEHRNITVMKRALAAFASGDAGELAGAFAQDVVWRVPGQSALAGEYRGHAEVFGFFGELMRRSNGTFRIEPVEMFANDGGGVFVDRLTAARDGRTLDIQLVLHVRIEDGQIACGTDHFHKEHVWDAFWG